MVMGFLFTFPLRKRNIERKRGEREEEGAGKKFSTWFNLSELCFSHNSSNNNNNNKLLSSFVDLTGKLLLQLFVLTESETFFLPVVYSGRTLQELSIEKGL